MIKSSLQVQAGAIPDHRDGLRQHLHAGLHVPRPIPRRRLPDRVDDAEDRVQLPQGHHRHLGWKTLDSTLDPTNLLSRRRCVFTTLTKDPRAR